MAWFKDTADTTTYLDFGVVPVSGTAARTVVLSFKNNEPAGAFRMGAWGTNATGEAWRWRLDTINKRFRVEIDGSFRTASTAGALDDDAWHKVAFGVAASANINEIVIYVDGVLQSQSGSSGTINTGTTTTCKIGWDETESGANGPICSYAEFAVYDRLLDAAEMVWQTGTNATPASLLRGRVLYSPLIRQFTEVSGGNTATENGANGSIVAHPSVIKPSVQILQFPPVAAGGAIAAALPIEFDVIADLKAGGQLAGLLPIEYNVSADLKADGQLVGILPIEFNVVADLKADGLLSGVLPIEFNVLASLIAQLGTTLSIEFNTVSSLTGQGKLDAILPIEFGIVANLINGAGELDAALSIEYSVIASLIADGQLIATPPIEFGVVADLLNATAGSLSAVLPIEFNVVAALSNASIPILPFIDRRHIAAFVN